MQKINIFLRNEKLRSYHRAGWLILILHFLYFSFGFYHGFPQSMQGIIFIFIAIAYRGILYVTQKKPFYPDLLFYYLMSCALLNMDNYIMGILVFILGMLNEYAIGRKVISFSDKGIKKNYFPFTSYEWEEMQNVILKDNVLTIDFKNNKLLQSDIVPDSNLDIAEFNELAQKSIASSMIL